MKTLLYVTFSYPPQGIVSAVRASRLVQHLSYHGWRSMVVAGRGLYGVADDPTIPDAAWRVVRPGFADPMAVLAATRTWFVRDRDGGAANAGTATRAGGSVSRRLANSLLPVTVNRMPNRFMTWLPGAILAIARSGVRPDAIFTSCSPPVDAVVGAVFKRLWGAPWIVEFRDLWSRNPVERLLGPFERLDEAIERAVVADADGLATVSEELATELRTLHGKTVFVLENGHDHPEPPAGPRPTVHRPRMEVVHGGSLYGGRRDPTPLLDALVALRDEGLDVRATFLGPDAAAVVVPEAVRRGLAGHVACRDRVPHREWLAMAASADALVLLEETTAEAAGNATGKLFEYVGMRKPVVATARPGGAIDRVLRRTGLGRASTTAGGLADELRRIAKGGGVAPVEEAIRALSWQSIAGRLAGELDRLTGGAGAG